MASSMSSGSHNTLTEVSLMVETLTLSTGAEEGRATNGIGLSQTELHVYEGLSVLSLWQ